MTGLEVKLAAYLSCSVLGCCGRCGGRRWGTPWSRCPTRPAALSSPGTSRGPTWGQSTETEVIVRSSFSRAGAGAPVWHQLKKMICSVQMNQRCKTVPAISSLSKGKLTDLKLSCLCHPTSWSQSSDMSFLYKWRWSMKAPEQETKEDHDQNISSRLVIL